MKEDDSDTESSNAPSNPVPPNPVKIAQSKKEENDSLLIIPEEPNESSD